MRVSEAKDTIWAGRQQIADAFVCTEDNARKHILNIYSSGEPDEAATSEKISEVRSEGQRSVKRELDLYNLDVILSVGCRVNSVQATRFRQWATKVLKDIVVNGFSLDEARLMRDSVAAESPYARLRSLRLSERNMYQKVRDVFAATATDYDGNSPAARSFFAMAQDKFHFAITGMTAAELILAKADASSENS